MKDKIAILIIVILSALLYTATIHGVRGNPSSSEVKGVLDQVGTVLELSPERGRYSHIYTLAEENKYELSEDWAVVIHPDVGIYEGRFYAFFAPGISYMALGFYMLGKIFGLAQVFSFAMISLFSIGAIVCIYKIGRNVLNLPLWASVFASFVFAFSSTAWGYAVTLYQHHVTTFLILFAFYSVWKFTKKTKWSFMWATFVGICYAVGIFIDYPNVVLFFPVMVYFLVSLFDIRKIEESYTFSIRWVGVFALVSFMAISSLHVQHNIKHYGGWKKLAGGIPSYRILPVVEPIIEVENVTATSTPEVVLEIDEEVTETYQEKDVVGFFTEKRVPMSFYTLVFSKDRGLLFFSPIFLLAIFGMYSARRVFTREYMVLLWTVLVNVFLYSSWGDPWGGWAFGPRYLIPSMSILSLFVALYISQGGFGFVKRFSAFLLALFCSGVSLMGVLTTNAVPTYGEGILLPAGKYNYLLNYELMMGGQSNSFLFDNFFSQSVTLFGYFMFIYAILVIMIISILFIMPTFTNKKNG